MSRQYAWPEGHWDWPVHLPYRHGVKAAGQMIFLGGQVAMDSDGNVLHKFDLPAQTRLGTVLLRSRLPGNGMIASPATVCALWQDESPEYGSPRSLRSPRS